MTNKNTSAFWIVFFLALGISVFGIISAAVFLAIGNIILGYIILIVCSLLSGFLSYSIVKKHTKREKTELLAGIVSPMLAVFILFLLFSFSVEGLKILRAEDGITKDNKINNVDVTSVVTGTPNPYFSSILFFILFNIPFLVGFFKKRGKKIKYLALYLSAPVIFLLIWLVSNLLSGWMIDIIRGYV